MIIKQLKVAGFRGFNDERVIDFHDRLTVISAPNSHGKTSISEALEFLLYGVTSKVAKADAKDEYRDSYRNRHFPADKPSYIEAVLLQDDKVPICLRVEIDPAGAVVKKADGAIVTDWPFRRDSIGEAKPFVLQHALKYLLLVAPAERFKGFAELLGLDEVETVFSALVSLCTKPQSSLPDNARNILSALATLEAELEPFRDLKRATAALKKGAAKLSDAYKSIEGRGDVLLGGANTGPDRLQRLKSARAEAAAKVYAGDVAIPVASPVDAAQFGADALTLSKVVDAEFLDAYGLVNAQGVAARLQKEAQLLGVGVDLLQENPSSCPLCSQPLDEALRESIRARHTTIAAEIHNEAERAKASPHIIAALAVARKTLRRHRELLLKPLTSLIEAMQPENKPKVVPLLGGAPVAATSIVQSAADEAMALRDKIDEATTAVETALDTCEAHVSNRTAILSEAENLAGTIRAYFNQVATSSQRIAELRPTLVGPAQILRRAVDALAGTEEISLIIKFIDNRLLVEKGLRIRDAVNGLKDLKRDVEQTLAEMMEAAMTTELTAAVMKWYSQIKTTGDPDVHFSGFGMDRTKTGDFKSRKLAVKAKSYGVELASAVSSLSESKLNALGLCVSIASAIRKPGPWSFLIIDDPIQSWDGEHATQFIDVIRALVEAEHKQVVVLSHQINWAKDVCVGCRSLNGIKYEITGYTKAGPNLIQREWSPLGQRIREADSIANDATADSVRLQYAEEEVRHICTQLAAAVADSKLNRKTSAYNMNTADVRSILLEVGAPVAEVDRINAFLVNADNSHHSPKTYQPNAQRVRQALGAIRSMMNAMAIQG